MSASGYQDKVPARIHEENVAKLASLMQEILSFEQASQHLERDIAAEQDAHWFFNFASNFDCCHCIHTYMILSSFTPS